MGVIFPYFWFFDLFFTMNEVNMKYSFSDLKKKKKISDFLDELRLFIEGKQVFTKNFRRSAAGRLPMAVQMKNFVRTIFERCF
jgi:hypothetical protein